MWPHHSPVLGHQSVSSIAQLYPTLCSPMDCSTPGLPVHHQLPEFTQTHVHWVGDAIQPSHPLLSPSPPALNLSQHQSLLKWVSSSHQVAIKWKLFVTTLSFPCGSDGKESACNVGDSGSIPGLGRSPGEGNGNPLQYSCLENSVDRGAWRAAVHRVTESATSEWLTLSDSNAHLPFLYPCLGVFSLLQWRLCLFLLSYTNELGLFCLALITILILIFTCASWRVIFMHCLCIMMSDL